MTEKDFEDIICKYPELIEEGLHFKGRQIRVFGKIMDVLFEDKFKQKLIVELKIGSIDRKHIGQVMEYEGSVLSEEDPTARIMLIGNRVPPNLRKAFDHHGIEWKEFSISHLKDFLTKKGDSTLLQNFDQEQTFVTKESRINNARPRVQIKTKNQPEVSVQSFLNLVEDEVVLNQINYLRKKIKSLDNRIYEYARKWTWIQYKLNRQFCGIDIYKRHFIVSIHLHKDLIANPARLDIANLKDKHYVKITVHPDTNLDIIFDNIKTAFNRQL